MQRFARLGLASFRFPTLVRFLGPIATALTVGVAPAQTPTAVRHEAVHPVVRVTNAFAVRAPESSIDALRVDLHAGAFEELAAAPRAVALTLPVPDRSPLELEIERFDVLAPDARFIVATEDGEVDLAPPDVLTYRGRVAGRPHSHVYVSISKRGSVNGYATVDGRTYFIAQAARDAAHRPGRNITISRAPTNIDLPEFETPCGVGDDMRMTLAPRVSGLSGSSVARAATAIYGGPQLATVAVDGDQSYIGLFDGDTVAAGDYVAQLIGAISDIYIRDFDVRLELEFVQLWPAGGEPFAATDIPGFADYWYDSRDPTQYALMHMMSGRRDTGYGGVAYVSGPCADFGFGISAFMNGSFPVPVAGPHLGNWDLVVSSHEMGHNMGTFHTHDGYDPPIDFCTSGVWSRGTIMSYCHTNPGGLLNTDIRFHARVQEVIADEVAFGGCLPFDCNENGVDDLDDIATFASPDVNANNKPDECEDCDNSGTLDPADIVGGAPDVNGNGILDECEPDCNGNNIPDEHDIDVGGLADQNGNRIPDVCDPDCDNDGTTDYVEIRDGIDVDYDRDGVPDGCQDCDGNSISDWIDMERQHNVYVADQGGFVREFHALSGFPIASLGGGAVFDPHDLVFGPDRQLYVTSNATDRVVRVDVDTGAGSIFVAVGSGGLNQPTALAFGPNGNLFVASSGTSSVIEYDGSSGALVGDFVSSGAGGLSGPTGMTFGPNGNLFVGDVLDRVLEFSGADGSIVGVFVAAGSGGLDDPKGMAFTPDGRLLVSSNANDRVIAYDDSGAPLGVFNDDLTPTGAWGLRIGPNGDVFVVRNTGTIRVIEYDVTNGRYVRSFIRSDSALAAPTGIAFRPASDLDCDGNYRLDVCDIADGALDDLNTNGIPDSCECPSVDAPTLVAGEVLKNRYLSFSGASGVATAVRVRLVDLPAPYDVWNDTVMWAGEPHPVSETASLNDNTPPTFTAASLDCGPHYTDWGSVGPVQLYHKAVVPGGVYELSAIAIGCSTASESDYSATLERTTSDWGDLSGEYAGGGWSGPDGGVDVATDALAVFDKFRGTPDAPTKARADLEPETPDRIINISDAIYVFDAFRGLEYPFAPGAVPCP